MKYLPKKFEAYFRILQIFVLCVNFGITNLAFGSEKFIDRSLLFIPYAPNDLSFSEAAYLGYQRLRDRGYPIDIVSNSSALTSSQILSRIKKQYADGVRIFILAGSELSVVTTMAAKRFPRAYFATLSGNARGNNVINYCLDCSNIGGSMAGHIAMQISKSKILGFVGGDEAVDGSEALKFKETILTEYPNSRILINWTGDWNNFTLAKKLTVQQIAVGADVIVADANSAVISAAIPFGNVKVIGWMVDASRKYSNVCASVVINTDAIYSRFINDILGGQFSSGNYSVDESDSVWSIVWAKKNPR